MFQIVAIVVLLFFVVSFAINNIDYYKVLGIRPSASQDQIKKQYRALAKQYHPDKNRDKSSKEAQEAEKKFLEITKAYEVLSDSDKRRDYDDSLRFGGGSQFHERFGSARKGFRNYEDEDDVYDFADIVTHLHRQHQRQQRFHQQRAKTRVFYRGADGNIYFSTSTDDDEVDPAQFFSFHHHRSNMFQNVYQDPWWIRFFRAVIPTLQLAVLATIVFSCFFTCCGDGEVAKPNRRPAASSNPSISTQQQRTSSRISEQQSLPTLHPNMLRTQGKLVVVAMNTATKEKLSMIMSKYLSDPFLFASIPFSPTPGHCMPNLEKHQDSIDLLLIAKGGKKWATLKLPELEDTSASQVIDEVIDKFLVSAVDGSTNWNESTLTFLLYQSQESQETEKDKNI